MEPGPRTSERAPGEATSSPEGSLDSKGVLEALTRRIGTLSRPSSGAVVALVGAISLMALLVVLFPLISPLLDLGSQALLLVPMFAFAASVLGLLLDLGGVGWRWRLRWFGLIALAVYFFLAAYRLVLGSLGLLEVRAPLWLTGLVLVCASAYVAFVVRNRGENVTLVRPVLAGGDWRDTLRNVFQWVRSLPLAVQVAVIVGVLGTLSLLSPYIFVLGAVLLGASVFALLLRAIRRRPLKQVGIVAVAALALTLVFGGISDALYKTGTGLMVSVGTNQDEAGGVSGTLGGASHRGSAMDEMPAGHGDDLPDLQREIEAYLGDRLLDIYIEEIVPGEGYYGVSVNFIYEGNNIQDAHYEILRDVAYVYYLIYAGEYGPYVSDAQVAASRTQGEPVYITRMLPEQGAYMEETRGDPQFTRAYYEVLLKDPALPY